MTPKKDLSSFHFVPSTPHFYSRDTTVLQPIHPCAAEECRIPFPSCHNPWLFPTNLEVCEMNPSRLFAIAIVSLVLITLLALLPATPEKVLADNNAFTFQGQYTAPACGPRHDFTIGSNTKTIDVV